MDLKLEKVPHTEIINGANMNIIEYAEKFIGTPYLYGANGAGAFDCSSFINELLMAFGHLPAGTDRSADMLYKTLKRENLPNFSRDKNENSFHSANYITYHPGAICFFGTKHRIVHVEMVYNAHMYIGCSGGDSKTDTLAKAMKSGAMVRLRPLSSRANPYAIYLTR